jgi:phage FluMu protein Com
VGFELTGTTGIILIGGILALLIIVYLAYRQMRSIGQMDRKIEDLEREMEHRAANPEFKTRCPRCRKVLEIPESERKNLRFKCPKCRSVVSVRNPRYEGESELPEDIRRRRREKGRRREREEDDGRGRWKDGRGDRGGEERRGKEMGERERGGREKERSERKKGGEGERKGRRDR